MRIGRILTLLALLLAPALVRAQEGGVEVDYNHPQKYIIAGVSVEGNTVFELIRDSIPVELYREQARDMAAQAKTAGLNIDYFPTNFVVQDGLIYYVDYECNPYMDEWSFENWGIKYWSRTDAFEKYLREH